MATTMVVVVVTVVLIVITVAVTKMNVLPMVYENSKQLEGHLQHLSFLWHNLKKAK